MGKNYKWLMLGLLSLAFFFSQADRVLFGLLTIPIQEELGLNDLQIGFANTVFFVVFACAVSLHARDYAMAATTSRCTSP